MLPTHKTGSCHGLVDKLASHEKAYDTRPCDGIGFPHLKRRLKIPIADTSPRFLSGKSHSDLLNVGSFMRNDVEGLKDVKNDALLFGTD